MDVAAKDVTEKVQRFIDDMPADLSEPLAAELCEAVHKLPQEVRDLPGVKTQLETKQIQVLDVEVCHFGSSVSTRAFSR